MKTCFGGDSCGKGSIHQVKLRQAGSIEASSSTPDRRTKVRLSTMDFWGFRSDTDVEMKDLVPPLMNLPHEALVEMATQMFVPLEVAGWRKGDRGTKRVEHDGC